MRWQQIIEFLHVSDNEKRPLEKESRKHRLWHVWPVMTTLSATFMKWFFPSQQLTIDERTIPTRNRTCPVRVYNKSKPYNTVLMSLAFAVP